MFSGCLGAFVKLNTSAEELEPETIEAAKRPEEKLEDHLDMGVDNRSSKEFNRERDEKDDK